MASEPKKSKALQLVDSEVSSDKLALICAAKACDEAMAMGRRQSGPVQHCSPSTFQRSQVISKRIEKISKDLQILNRTKSYLNLSQHQMEDLGKIDLELAAKIAKDSCEAITKLKPDDLLKTVTKIVREARSEEKKKGKKTLDKFEKMTLRRRRFGFPADPVEDEAFMKNIRDGLNAPDLPYFEEQVDKPLPLD